MNNLHLLYRSKNEMELNFMLQFVRLSLSVLVWGWVSVLASIWVRLSVWFNTWVFADWVSLNWFFVILVVDTITGVVMHLKQQTFSAKELMLKTLINKVLVSCIWFVMIHVVARFSELNPEAQGSELLAFFRNGVLFLYFLQSIIDNTIIITNGKFPPGYAAWRKKFGKD